MKKTQLRYVQGGNQHELNARSALSALMRGDNERFQEILQTLPSPPIIKSVNCEKYKFPPNSNSTK